MGTCLTCVQVSAQTISFNEKGQLTGNIPERIYKGDSLQAMVAGSENPNDGFIKSLKTRAAAAKALAVKLLGDQDRLDQLMYIYGIGDQKLRDIIADCDNIELGRTPENGYLPEIKDLPDYYRIEIKDIPDSKKTFGITTPSAKFAAAPNDAYSMQLNLTFTDKFKKASYDWLTGSKDKFKPVTAEKRAILKDLKLKEQSKLSQIKDIIALRPGDDLARIEEAIRQIQTLRTELRTLSEDILNNIKLDDKEWVLKWFWYQGAHDLPLLNPFKFATESSLGGKPDTTENIGLWAKIKARQNYLANKKDLAGADADRIIDEMTKFHKTIAANQEAMENYNKTAANNQKAMADFGQTETLLNSPIFYLSDRTLSPRLNYWMRNHNAASGHSLMTLNPKKEYLDEDKMVVLDHNLTADQHVTIDFTFTPIASPQTFLGEQFTNAIKTLPALKSVVVANVAEADPAVTTRSRAYNRLVDELQKDVIALKRLDPALDYVLAQTNPDIDIKENPSQNAVYHTELENDGDPTGDQQGGYNIKLKTPVAAAVPSGTAAPAAAAANTTPAAGSAAASNASPASNNPAPAAAGPKFKVQVNKRYRVFPMAGFAYTTDQFSTVGTNADGTAPGKVTQETPLRLIAGLKFFIHSTDIRNRQFFTEKDDNDQPLLWTRVHIDLAVAVSDPVKNIYTGGGVDLWPGLSVNLGLVFNRYQYNTYSIGSSATSRTLYRPGFYFGLTTDVAVITELGKFLTSGK
jgi:hypothetical protein